MELYVELFDVTCDLRSLLFVLFELMLEFGHLDRIFRGHCDRGRWDRGRGAALLTIQGHSGRRRVHYKGGSAFPAGENNVAAGFWGRNGRTTCGLHRRVKSRRHTGTAGNIG